MALGGLWEAIDNYAQAQDELVEGANQLASAIAGAAMSAMTRDDIVDLTGYPPIWCCGFAPTRVSAGPMAELGLVCPRRFAVDGGTVAACAEDEGHLPVWAAARSLGLASPTRGRTGARYPAPFRLVTIGQGRQRRRRRPAVIYLLTKRERLRVLRCAEDFITRIPDPERWLMLDGAHRLGLTTEIEIDLSDPTDVSVIWLGRKILTVPRQALRCKEPLEDHIVTDGNSDVSPIKTSSADPSGPGAQTAREHLG